MREEERFASVQPRGAETPMGLLGLPDPQEKAMSRTRYLELAGIATTICDQLEKMQVKRSEGCVVKELCDRLWNL